MVTGRSGDQLDEFFGSCPPLKGAASLGDRLSAFLDRHKGRNVVCVTSGGTTVPLERQCVRFIDNFSKGSRGALSTERFLGLGYAVVFLYRDSSLRPFEQALPGLVDCLHAEEGAGGGVVVRPEGGITMDRICGVLALRDATREAGTLLPVEYTTLFDYLQALKMIGTAMKGCGSRALFYLASAVSDFYMPWGEMAEHKIQSSDGPMKLELSRTPKMLGELRSAWAPSAFHVSFKLETDVDILIKKASGALHSYGVHMVVANILEMRKDRVILVTQPEGAGEVVQQVIDRPEGDEDIERLLVEQVVQAHQRHIGDT